MDKKTWQEFHKFSDEDMLRIEMALSISDGKIVDIMDKPLDYQDIKIKFDFNKKGGTINTKGV